MKDDDFWPELLPDELPPRPIACGAWVMVGVVLAVLAGVVFKMMGVV
jgi:hypothetical protein